MDLIEGISQILGFKYELELVKDNKYGSYNKETKTWDGLVKHLLDRVSMVDLRVSTLFELLLDLSLLKALPLLTTLFIYGLFLIIFTES